MKTDDRIVNIIEDHVRICEAIDQIICSFENGIDLPNFIPVLHDTVVTDQLGKIVERLKGTRP